MILKLQHVKCKNNVKNTCLCGSSQWDANHMQINMTCIS